jgi:DNA-binding CsgD family transcriptional regulator
VDRPTDAVAAVTQVALAAFGAPGSIDAMPAVLAALRLAIGADTAGFYLHERRGWTIPLYITPDAVWRIIPFARVPTTTAVALHPGIRHLVVDAPLDPFAVTDLVSDRAWRGSEFVSGLRRDWDRNYQFAIPVLPESVGTEPHVWVVGRMSSDFTRADHETAEALTPVLTAVARQWTVLQQIRNRSSAGTLLTQRELAVLALQARGVGTPGIARSLGMTPRTAQKHAEHIYRKLGVHSRVEAVQVTRALGLVGPPAQGALHVDPPPDGRPVPP